MQAGEKTKMKKIKIITTLSSFLLLSSVICHPTSAYASPVGLAIDPPLLRVQIKPGKSITKVFNIQNTEDADKNIVVRIIPFTKSDGQGNPVIDVKNNSSWLRYFGLSNTNMKFNEPFLLKSKTKEQIVLSVSIPDTANLEDIYATLLVTTYDNTLENDLKGTSISASIGANLLISITANLNPNTILKIEKIIPTSGNFLKIGQRYFADNLTPLTFSATAINDGLFLTDTKGTFRVINKKSSETLALKRILPQYVIAKSSRQLTNIDGKPFTFTPALNTLGLHTINFDIKSENTNTSNSIEIFFFPFKAGFAIFISIFILKVIFSITTKKH